MHLPAKDALLCIFSSRIPIPALSAPDGAAFSAVAAPAAAAAPVNNHNATNVINFTRTIILSNLLAISQLTNHRKIYPCHKAIARRLLSTSCGLRMSGLRGSRRPKRLAAPRAQRARAHARVLARIISRTRSLSSSAFSARWSSFFCSGSASSNTTSG